MGIKVLKKHDGTYGSVGEDQSFLDVFNHVQRDSETELVVDNSAYTFLTVHEKEGNYIVYFTHAHTIMDIDAYLVEALDLEELFDYVQEVRGDVRENGEVEKWLEKYSQVSNIS